MKKRLYLIASVIYFLQLGQTLFIGSRVALASIALYISYPEKTQALPLKKAKDSKGRDMRFYMTRGKAKRENGDIRGALKDYSIAIRMHDRYNYSADHSDFVDAIIERASLRDILGNKRAFCSDVDLAAKNGSKFAIAGMFNYCK